MNQCKPGKHRNKKQRGMALLAVLWMVAALTIIVSGLTRSIREEARVMSLSRQNVQAQALGDAAIQLALQALVASNTPWPAPGRHRSTIAGSRCRSRPCL